MRALGLRALNIHAGFYATSVRRSCDVGAANGSVRDQVLFGSSDPFRPPRKALRGDAAGLFGLTSRKRAMAIGAEEAGEVGGPPLLSWAPGVPFSRSASPPCRAWSRFGARPGAHGPVPAQRVATPRRDAPLVELRGAPLAVAPEASTRAYRPGRRGGNDAAVPGLAAVADARASRCCGPAGV